MSIASEISRLQSAKADIKTSIEAKGVTVPSATKLDGYSALIDQISGGGTVVEDNDVNFYDYDGTLVYSYSKTDFLALNEMPTNPTHAGLTAQGWNWTLSDAKTYVTSYGVLNIGQHYITSDEKTRLYVHLYSDDYLYVSSHWQQSVANGVTIDWGDGSTPETVGGTGVVIAFHTYSSPGDYVIEYTVTNGTVIFGQSSDNSRIFGPAVCSATLPHRISSNVYKIELGKCSGFNSHCFKQFKSLETINIPIGASTWNNNATNLFQYCNKLKCVVIPDGVTYLGTNCFYEMYDAVAICIPKTITDIGGSAVRCTNNITRLCFPSGCTIRNTYGLADNYKLRQLILPEPSIYSANGTYTFYNDWSVEELPLLKISGSITSIIGYTYSNCKSLKTITIPNTVTSIGDSAFNTCYSLRSIILPNITEISGSVFYGNTSLKEINIPSTVTTIKAGAFNGCSNLRKITISATTPPTLANINAFSSIFDSCAMIVPYASLSTYRSATNWSNYKKNLVGYLDSEPIQVDYITSNNGAFINTLIPISEIGKVIIECRVQGITTGGGKGSVDGAYNQDGKYASTGRDQTANSLIAQWGGNKLTLGTNDSGWHTFEVNVLEKTVKLDGNSSSLSVGIIKAVTGYCVFKPYNAPINYFLEASDRRSVKIWDIYGNLVRDMIPVKIDNAAYFYDRVDKLVFSNANSTGTLSYTDF